MFKKLWVIPGEVLPFKNLIFAVWQKKVTAHVPEIRKILGESNRNIFNLYHK
jgi:hypothetical protein